MIKTVLTDLDGVLIEQSENYMEHVAKGGEFKVLPGTLEKFKEWETKGYKVIITTARKESSRRITEELLAKLGIFYDQLVMGCGVGARVVINDLKPNKKEPMAVAFNLKRNEGISKIHI